MDLSILIPSRNELFLSRTIQDILEHAETDIEIIAVLDGEWADPPVPQNERVTLLHYPESIGQRAACNVAARIATGKYLMKLDAHCAVAQGFDRILIDDMQPDWTQVPVMRNLWVFNWKCPNGHTRYQGISGPCKECGEPTERDIVWISKTNPQSLSYCFDSDPHFQYFNEYKNRPEFKGDLTETMSLQGSCWMMTKDKYFELGMNDESWGSWGSQGLEIAIKTWLSGGRVIVNHKTYYAHCFRTAGGDFSFPYAMSQRQAEHAKKCARDLFFNNKWDKQVHPLSWLVKKFWPVKGWTDEDLAKLLESEASIVKTRPEIFRGVMNDTIPANSLSDTGITKGILYYTDNKLDPGIMKACQEQLLKSVNGHRIVSVSLYPIDFGDNIVLPLERGHLTMFKQILTGLEELDCDIIYFCEHDVLYSKEHFDFVPPERDKYYYNKNWWKLRLPDGFCLQHEGGQTSGLCAYRDTLLKHYKQRVINTEKMWNELGGNTHPFRSFIRDQGFEPGTHHRASSVDKLGFEYWDSPVPIIDVRHNGNLTANRWSIDQFRRKPKTWIESDTIPYWGKGIDIVNSLEG